MRKHALQILAIVGALGATRAHAQEPSLSATPATYGTRIILLGDPQLHNIYGGSIKSMGSASDSHASNVAIRPPVLNIAAPLILEMLVTKAQEVAHGDVALVLGDVANIACTGELHDFQDSMNRALGASSGSEALWLSAHGNHDSFMAGNFQDVTRDLSGPGVDATELLPTTNRHCAWRPPCVSGPSGKSCCEHEQYAGWTANEVREYAYTRDSNNSWPQVCARPAGMSSVTSDKHVWLAWYLEHLGKIGLHFSFKKKTDDCSSGACRTPTIYFDVALVSNDNARLAMRNFRAVGRWYMPNNSGENRRKWWSYVLQSFDATPSKRVILIDTSAGADLNMGGTEGYVGVRQLEDIANEIAQARREGKTVVVAAHIPLSDLRADQRQRLLSFGIDGYLSAHTHAPTAFGGGHGVPELNIGSTTDWPMELAVQDFAVPVTTAVDYKSAVTVFSLGMPDEKWPGHDIPRSQIQQCPDVDVIFPRRWTGKLHRAQACAHVVDAKQLAEHSDLLGKATWNEHAGDACATGNLVQAAAADLQTLLPSATDRNDPAKVTQAVCLAARKACSMTARRR
jgi:hypothetical protein